MNYPAYLATCAVMLVSSLITAQEEPKLLMSSGVYHLGHAVPDNAINTLDQEPGGILYRIVQFTRSLSANEQDLLKTQVGEILDYLPVNAYIMAIPAGTEMHRLDKLPLHAISPLLPAMKVTRRLWENEIPDYAWRGMGRIEAVAVIYPHVNPETARMALESAGAFIVAYDEQHLRFTIEMSLEQTETIAGLFQVRYLQEGEDPGEPENFNALRSHRANAINTNYSGGMQYNGSGIVLGHGDDGDIGPHIDFTGRIVARNTGPSSGDHGDHVAGTVLGAGNLEPLAQGMAPGADLVYYQYPRNLSFVDADYNTYNVRITVSSYSNGCNAGYTSYAQQMDQDIRDNTKLMHVFSAGNNGTSNCGYGAGAGWGNVTGGHKVGKNVLTVANVTASDIASSSSSRGPAADGRIKPDVAAVGSSVYSTIEDNQYGTKSGTSMACPGAAGSLAQLTQAFKETHGIEPDGGLTKAFVLNTADDLGNPGPDFTYGYGRINNLRAARDIEAGQYTTGTVTTSQTNNINITVPANVSELRVMLYWTDPAATPLTARALVNDLNATLVDPGTATWLPWVLDPTPNSTSLSQYAQRAVDSLNNMEQITISDPAAGTYVLQVEGTNVPLGPQEYYVVYSFIEDRVELTYPAGGEALIPGSANTIYWDASPGTSSFHLEYSVNGGTSWNTISNPGSSARRASWTVPSIVSDEVLLRISRGVQTDLTNAPATIIGRPNGLNVVQTCPDSFVVAWNPVPGAAGYNVHVLGAKYMDSVNYTTDTFYVFQGFNPYFETWFSVAAVTPGAKAGMRADAVQRAPGIMACTVLRDAQAIALLNPQAGTVTNCHDMSATPVTIELSNGGMTALDTIPVAYHFNNVTYRDTAFVSLAQGNSVPFTFSQSFNASALGNHTISVWTELAGDENAYNDTIEITWEVISGATAQLLPLSEDFDSWTGCGTSADCGNTNCNLGGQWFNLTNGTRDDIDWRVDNAGTPSSGTGPANDHTTGNSTGNYLYLEASGGCSFQEAILLSPCIDLSSASLPELSFWSHMSGNDMGELHVDVFSDGTWTLDVVAPRVGDQGNQWLEDKVSLLPWVGQTITVRFRGSTGADYESDIAIDDVSIVEINSAPQAAFSVSNAMPCVGQSVQLLDQSSNVPNSWNWTITPNTFSYMNGTNSTSQFPEVEFTALGLYTVKLVASNTAGSDSIEITGMIDATSGEVLSVLEEFEGTFIPVGWDLENPDGQITWEDQLCIGSDGQMTTAARINNYDYNTTGESDALVSQSIDLTGSVLPALIFDLSYSGKINSPSDQFMIEISTNCGNSWQPTGYDLQGTSLRTTAPTATAFIPTGFGHWRRDTLDLSTWIGNSVKLRLRNITNNGNVLYIDNFQIYDLSVTPPVAKITADLKDLCTASTLVFEDTASGAEHIDWNFGAGASPVTATGAGPHSVNYATAGSKRVSIKVRDVGGSDDAAINFTLTANPVAQFTTTAIQGLEYQMTNQSAGTANSYYWDFDDNGDTSTLPNPVHEFSQEGTYNIMLVATNACGVDTLIAAVTVVDIGLNEDIADRWVLSPNPAKTELRLKAKSGALNLVQVEILDLTGRIVSRQALSGNESNVLLNISHLPAGIYLLRATGDESVVIRFVVE